MDIKRKFKENERNSRRDSESAAKVIPGTIQTEEFTIMEKGKMDEMKMRRFTRGTVRFGINRSEHAPSVSSYNTDYQ